MGLPSSPIPPMNLFSASLTECIRRFFAQPVSEAALGDCFKAGSHEVRLGAENLIVKSK